MVNTLLEAKNLKKHFPITQGLVLMKQVGAIKAVDGVSFSINERETFGLVGESGCGKSTTGKLILLLERLTSGSIFFEGRNIQQLSKLERKNYRRSVQTVFQDPYSSLSPRMRVGDIIGEPIRVNHTLPKKAIRERVRELLEFVGLSRRGVDLYPHEFSGGQRQRIAIARAISLNPKLIILDEPVSALDVSIRAQIMNLLQDIQQQVGLSYLLIAHDLAIVRHMSKKIGVMYLGKLVETAETEELYRNPLHPYTQALFSAALPAHPDKQRDMIILPGEVPTPINPPSGCHFHPRCFHVKSICSEVEPSLQDVGNSHLVACHLYNK
jgi:oligopeptide/dipeptide ABC transporter ATP-binding protein